MTKTFCSVFSQKQNMPHLFLLFSLPHLLSATTLLPPGGHVTVRVPLPKQLLTPSAKFTSLSITANSSNIKDGSILFSAFHRGFLNYWSLDANEQEQGASKELCELPGKQDGKEEAKYVSVAAFSTSSSEQAVEFNATWEETELQLSKEKNLILGTGSSKVFYAFFCSQTQRVQVLYYPPPVDYNTGESYLISLSSPSDDCFLVAIRWL